MNADQRRAIFRYLSRQAESVQDRKCYTVIKLMRRTTGALSNTPHPLCLYIGGTLVISYSHCGLLSSGFKKGVCTTKEKQIGWCRLVPTLASPSGAEKNAEYRKIARKYRIIIAADRIVASRIINVSMMQTNADQCRLIAANNACRAAVTSSISTRLARRIRRTATAWPWQEASEDREGWTQVIHVDIAGQRHCIAFIRYIQRVSHIAVLKKR